MIRTGNFKYSVYRRNNIRELFDLSKDPGETKNLAKKPAYKAKRRELEQQLKTWMKQTNDPAIKVLFPEDTN